MCGLGPFSFETHQAHAAGQLARWRIISNIGTQCVNNALLSIERVEDATYPILLQG